MPFDVKACVAIRHMCSQRSNKEQKNMQTEQYGKMCYF